MINIPMAIDSLVIYIYIAILRNENSTEGKNTAIVYDRKNLLHTDILL